MGRINIVWTAVVSALAAMGSLIAAGLGNSLLTLSLGMTSVSAAILSARE